MKISILSHLFRSLLTSIIPSPVFNLSLLSPSIVKYDQISHVKKQKQTPSLDSTLHYSYEACVCPLSDKLFQSCLSSVFSSWHPNYFLTNSSSVFFCCHHSLKDTSEIHTANGYFPSSPSALSSAFNNWNLHYFWNTLSLLTYMIPHSSGFPFILFFLSLLC